MKAIILDVGSGHNPDPSANLLCDLFLDDTEHRSGEFVSDSRPLICCSVEALPFKDQVIDYVLCRHVVEHTTNPKQAIKELKRIAKAGYIAFPSKIGELFFLKNQPHTGIIDTKGELTQIRPKHPIKQLANLLWGRNMNIQLRKRLERFLRPIRDSVIKW